MSALHDGDWEFAEASTSSHRSQASGLVAAHLQWHLERSCGHCRWSSGRTGLIARPLSGGWKVVGQDMAHGNQAGQEGDVPTAAAGA